MIDIAELDKADVLRVLYDNAKAQGLGWLHYTPEPMTKAEAEALLDQTPYFDYVYGRVMKISLKKDSTQLDPELYDRDNGPGAAARAIDSIR